MSTAGLEAAVAKMQDGGVHPTAIEVFRHYYKLLESGETGILHESDLKPLESPTRLADLQVCRSTLKLPGLRSPRPW
jgi:UTP--glucose-1-phosphate uridylyltransferase